MQIVIDIPEEEYKCVQITGCIGNKTYISNAIYNGTPLPKGHGRIADIDKVLEEMKATRTYDISFALERVKPIIEADKGYEVKIITRGNCMMCGKELDADEGLFFCKECEEKGRK